MSITKVTILKGILLALLAGTVMIGVFMFLVVDWLDTVHLVIGFLLMLYCLAILFIGMRKLYHGQGLKNLGWGWIYVLAGIVLAISTSVIVGGSFLHRWMPAESYILIATGSIMAAIIAGTGLFITYKRVTGNMKPAPFDLVE